MRMGGLLQMAANVTSAGTSSGAAIRVGRSGRDRVPGAEVTGSLVDVDRPDRRRPGCAVPARRRWGRIRSPGRAPRRRARTARPSQQVSVPGSRRWPANTPDRWPARGRGRGAAPAPCPARIGPRAGRRSTADGPPGYGRYRDRRAREIRVFGDPVLKTAAAEVVDIDGKLVRLADEMLEVMYDARPRPGGDADRRAEAAVRLRRRRRPATRSSTRSSRRAGGVGVRRGLPVHPAPLRRDDASQGGPAVRLGPRRERGGDRG